MTAKKEAVADVFKPASSIVESALRLHLDPMKPIESLPQFNSLKRVANRARQRLRPDLLQHLEFFIDHGFQPNNFLKFNFSLKRYDI